MRHLLETLLVVFIILKLVHVIDWNWWIILSPFWIPLIVAMVLYGIYIFIKRSEYV